MPAPATEDEQAAGLKIFVHMCPHELAIKQIYIKEFLCHHDVPRPTEQQMKDLEMVGPEVADPNIYSPINIYQFMCTRQTASKAADSQMAPIAAGRT